MSILEKKEAEFKQIKTAATSRNNTAVAYEINVGMGRKIARGQSFQFRSAFIPTSATIAPDGSFERLPIRSLRELKDSLHKQIEHVFASVKEQVDHQEVLSKGFAEAIHNTYDSISHGVNQLGSYLNQDQA